MPSRYVTPAAPMPMASWRRPRVAGEVPESRPTTPPVSSSAKPTREAETTSAASPVMPSRKGMMGKIAPEEKKQKLDAAAGQVDEQEFVVLDIEQWRRRQGDLGGSGRGEELPLRPHGNELAGPHGQCAGQQPGDAAEEYHLAAHARGRHAHDE